MMQEMNSFIDALHLQPHPEGGFYREMHRSLTSIQVVNSSALKSAYTSIYYLLAGSDFSSWHRIQSDETWFFHAGCDALIYFFDENKQLQTIQLGLASKNLQATIPANTWFSARPLEVISFCLVSCAVAPGFEFSDFEIGKRNELLNTFGGSPKNIQAIEALTRD
ncbi:cupin domain-containing protein [Polynucleobacter sp. 71A-WALBACH]|uniref:cupin domain-containing protein n=1 Tax=Polynucleobacter sp. 71A-WALBACH TaxID=2689097 RepID=UPI001C0AC9CB|nr:cupin domain-containing protein [Polynucleobacter sp. 71A-WALBACH]MBU3593982.1 cupin domain-containing protein [Polynucleobacter sp. 71A-WALBACH]